MLNWYLQWLKISRCGLLDINWYDLCCRRIYVILLGLFHAPVIWWYDEVTSCTSTHSLSWRKFQDLWAVTTMWWGPYVLDQLHWLVRFISCVAALGPGPIATSCWNVRSTRTGSFVAVPSGYISVDAVRRLWYTSCSCIILACNLRVNWEPKDEKSWPRVTGRWNVRSTRTGSFVAVPGIFEWTLLGDCGIL